MSPRRASPSRLTEVDTAAVSIDPTALSVAEGDADGASYSVVLGSEPTAEVTVTVGGHVGTDLSLSGPTLSATNSLTFTPADWSTAQTVTVTASEDDDAVSDDDPVTLTHAVTGSGEYQGVAAAGVKVTITEVDTAAVGIDPIALTVAEGDSGSYSVVLGSEPTAEVTVDRSAATTGQIVSLCRSHAERHQFPDLHSSGLEHRPDGDGHRGSEDDDAVSDRCSCDFDARRRPGPVSIRASPRPA